MLGCQKVSVYSQVGLPGEEIRQLGALGKHNGHPFRLLSVGNLLHLKGFELGVRAFAEFHSRFPASEYWLIGEGPERKRLERLARELGVSGKVVFWGALPRQDVFARLSDCDVLVHPSLHDSGGWVCAEAMAARRLVICLDLGGPAVQVTDETGVKIPAVTPKQVVNDLAKAMLRVARDPELRRRMGEAGRKRLVESFAWDKKGEFLAGLYKQLESI
jgi:glycosyltransferase involved in cell wall biosynthesis